MCGGGRCGDNGMTPQHGAMRDPPEASELAHRAPLGCAPAMLDMPCDVHHGLGHTCGATWLPPGQGGSRPPCVRQHQGRHGGTCDGSVWRWQGHPMGMAHAHLAPCDMLRRDEDARAHACMKGSLWLMALAELIWCVLVWHVWWWSWWRHWHDTATWCNARPTCRE